MEAGLFIGLGGLALAGLVGWRWWTMRDYLLYSHQYDKFKEWEERRNINEEKTNTTGKNNYPYKKQYRRD